MPLLRSVSALALTAMLAIGAAAPVSAEDAATFTDAQRKGIETIVREYLLKNPEVLQEVNAEAERRAQETQRLAQTAAAKEAGTALLDSPHGVTVGNPQGDVTLVEFFDYNCGYCRRALSDVQTLLKADPKLKVVLKDFPVLGNESVEASKIALAAKQQLKGDRMFDFHAKLFETKGRVNAERALAVGKEMGLDVERLKKDAAGPEVQAALVENMEFGDKLSLTGTPAFVVGNEVVNGAVGVESIQKTISAVRQCGHASC